MHLHKGKSGDQRGKTGLLALLGAAACLAIAGTASAAEKAVVDAAVTAEQAVEFDVYLPLRDRAGAEALLTELHTPESDQLSPVADAG